MGFSIQRDSEDDESNSGYCTMKIGNFPENDVEYEFYFSLRDERIIVNIILQLSNDLLKSK